MAFIPKEHNFNKQNTEYMKSLFSHISLYYFDGKMFNDDYYYDNFLLASYEYEQTLSYFGSTQKLCVLYATALTYGLPYTEQLIKWYMNSNHGFNGQMKNFMYYVIKHMHIPVLLDFGGDFVVHKLLHDFAGFDWSALNNKYVGCDFIAYPSLEEMEGFRQTFLADKINQKYINELQGARNKFDKDKHEQYEQQVWNKNNAGTYHMYQYPPLYKNDSSVEFPPITEDTVGMDIETTAVVGPTISDPLEMAGWQNVTKPIADPDKEGEWVDSAKVNTDSLWMSLNVVMPKPIVPKAPSEIPDDVPKPMEENVIKYDEYFGDPLKPFVNIGLKQCQSDTLKLNKDDVDEAFERLNISVSKEFISEMEKIIQKYGLLGTIYAVSYIVRSGIEKQVEWKAKMKMFNETNILFRLLLQLIQEENYGKH